MFDLSGDGMIFHSFDSVKSCGYGSNHGNQPPPAIDGTFHDLTRLLTFFDI